MGGIKRKSLGSIFFCWLEQPEIRHYFNSQYTVFWKSWILEKGLKFPHQFSRPGKILENGKKSPNLHKVLYKWNFSSFWSNLIQSRPYVCSASWQQKSLNFETLCDLKTPRTLELKTPIRVWEKQFSLLSFFSQQKATLFPLLGMRFGPNFSVKNFKGLIQSHSSG